LIEADMDGAQAADKRPRHVTDQDANSRTRRWTILSASALEP